MIGPALQMIRDWQWEKPITSDEGTDIGSPDKKAPHLRTLSEVVYGLRAAFGLDDALSAVLEALTFGELISYGNFGSQIFCDGKISILTTKYGVISKEIWHKLLNYTNCGQEFTLKYIAYEQGNDFKLDFRGNEIVVLLKNNFDYRDIGYYEELFFASDIEIYRPSVTVQVMEISAPVKFTKHRKKSGRPPYNWELAAASAVFDWHYKIWNPQGVDAVYNKLQSWFLPVDLEPEKTPQAAESKKTYKKPEPRCPKPDVLSKYAKWLWPEFRNRIDKKPFDKNYKILLNKQISINDITNATTRVVFMWSEYGNHNLETVEEILEILVGYFQCNSDGEFLVAELRPRAEWLFDEIQRRLPSKT